MVSRPSISPTPSVPTAIPPLEPGDRLTREEFERRFDATGLKKAELIEGVVHMPPPTRWENHATPHADFVTILGNYRAATPGVSVGDAGSIRLDLTNEPQPDVAMIVDPALGGQAVISSNDYIEGGPELLAEISASTVSIDLHSKLATYRRNRVQEYVVWRVYDGVIDWFALKDKKYHALPANPDGTIRSEVFPGLWLDAAALIRGDLAEALRVLQQGLASAEHAAFVALLQSRQSSAPRSKP